MIKKAFLMIKKALDIIEYRLPYDTKALDMISMRFHYEMEASL